MQAEFFHAVASNGALTGLSSRPPITRSGIRPRGEDMKRWISGISLAACLALLIGVGPRVAAQNAGAPALVIQGGTLIDGNGGAPLPNSTVVIQGNRITAVGTAGQVQIPAGAQVSNANGKYVLPGLWD